MKKNRMVSLMVAGLCFMGFSSVSADYQQQANEALEKLPTKVQQQVQAPKIQKVLSKIANSSKRASVVKKFKTLQQTDKYKQQALYRDLVNYLLYSIQAQVNTSIEATSSVTDWLQSQNNKFEKFYDLYVAAGERFGEDSEEVLEIVALEKTDNFSYKYKIVTHEEKLEREALRWLFFHNNMYENEQKFLKELYDDKEKDSEVTKKILTMIQDGSFKYGYKKKTTGGNRVKLSGGAANWRSGSMDTGFVSECSGVDPEVCADYSKESYILSVVDFARSWRKFGKSNETIINNAKKTYGENDIMYKHIKYYARTGKTDFR